MKEKTQPRNCNEKSIVRKRGTTCTNGKNKSTTHLIVVGEVHLGSDHCNIKLIVYPGFPDTGVEECCLKPRIGANKQNQVSFFYTNDFCVEQV